MKFSKIAKITSILFIVAAILGAFSMVFATEPSIPGPVSPGGEGVTQLNIIVGAVIFVIQGKADVKKMSVIYIVGAVLLFAATGILQLIRNLVNGTFNN